MLLLDTRTRDDLLFLHRHHARLYRLAALCVRKRVGIEAWGLQRQGSVFVTTDPGAVALLAQSFTEDAHVAGVRDGVLDAVRGATACVAALGQPAAFHLNLMWDLSLVEDKYTALHNLRQFVNANTRAALAREGVRVDHQFDPYVTAVRPVKPRHRSLLRPGNGIVPDIQIFEGGACRFNITDHVRVHRPSDGRAFNIPCPEEGFDQAGLQKALSQIC